MGIEYTVRKKQRKRGIPAPRFHEDRFRGNDPGKARLYGAGIKRNGFDESSPCILITTYYLIIKYANMILEEFVVG